MKAILPFLLTLVLLTSCQKDPEPVTVITTNEVIQTSMSEELTPNPKKNLLLQLRTVKNIYCPGAFFQYQVANAISSNIEITVEKIKNIDNCQNPNSIAYSAIPVGNLINGIYDVQMHMASGTTYHGSIHVSDSGYKLFWSDADKNLQNATSVLMKNPANLCWGFVGFDDMNLASEAQYAANLFFKGTSGFIPTSAGTYTGFTYDGIGKYTLSDPTYQNYKNVIVIVAFLPSDIITLKKDLDTFRQKNGSKIKVQITDVNGNEY